MCCHCPELQAGGCPEGLLCCHGGGRRDDAGRPAAPQHDRHQEGAGWSPGGKCCPTNSSSSSRFPKLYIWGSPFWARVVHMWPFLNLIIEVVTFCLHEWCMLGVFLLPAFTHVGHECWGLLSPCHGMCVCRLDLILYSHPKEVGGNGVRTQVNSKGKIPSTSKTLLDLTVRETTLREKLNVGTGRGMVFWGKLS